MYKPAMMDEPWNGFLIPEYMQYGLRLWIEEGIHPGYFLCAVLRNDLQAAVTAADDDNLRNLPAYIFFLYNYAPAGCWGSENNFKNWKGLKGEKS